MAYVFGFIVIFVYVMAFSLCRISGHYSCMEEGVTCPKCKGVCGIETTPNDWHDCDLCEASGTLPRAEALAYIDA